MVDEASDTRDQLFGRRRFVFWCTAPFLVIGAFVFALTYDAQGAKGPLLRIAVPIVCALALLGIYDTHRFAWAMRTITALVFLAYVWYFVDEVFVRSHGFEPTPRAAQSPWNATRGLLVIGLPSLWYTVFGRLDPRRRRRADERTGS